MSCEYRLTRQQAGENFNTGAGPAVIVAGGDPNSQICGVKTSRLEMNIFCELPNETNQTCPIAQWKRGEIDFTQANIALRKIFDTPQS